MEINSFHCNSSKKTIKLSYGLSSFSARGSKAPVSSRAEPGASVACSPGNPGVGIIMSNYSLASHSKDRLLNGLYGRASMVGKTG